MSRYIYLVFLIYSINLMGQRGIEIGGHVGISHYYGDLNPTYSLSDPGLSFGLKIRRNFNERLSLSLGADFGKIKRSDEDSNNMFEQNRNLSFYSNLFDFSANLEFNFFPYIHGSDDFYYTPYIFGGFSFMKFNPRADFQGTTFDLRDLGTEGQLEGDEYFLISGSISFGFGFKWDYNKDWSFNVALSGRLPHTDFVDDVNGFYPDYTQLRIDRGDVAVALANRTEVEDFGNSFTQRGNGQDNDSIFFLTIGVLRYFGKLRCPPISNTKF